MTKYILILLLGWSCKLPAQQLLQAPFVSYLGRGIEDHKVILFNRVPYEGIGKRMLLEQFPALWTSTFSRFSTNSHPLIDAFGAVGPKYNGVQKTRLALLLNQRGPIEADFANHSKWKRFGFVNELNQQIRPNSDVNRNQLLDFAAGQRFSTHNSIYYENGNIRTGVYSYFTQGKSVGGAKLVKTQAESGLPLAGYTEDAQHWQSGIWLDMNNYDWGNLGLSVDFNQHQQTLNWKTYAYQGKERQASYQLTYRHEWNTNKLYGALQYAHDETTEQVDSLPINPHDEYWRGIVEWEHVWKRHFAFKSRVNVEKHLNQGITFRPALQFDWKIRGNEAFVLSVFANSGQRLNKPLNLHLDRLSDAYTVDWKVKNFEVAHKMGLHLTKYSWRERLVKLVLDHTWFKHKIITDWDHAEKRLVFSNSEQLLQRTALELVSGREIIRNRKLDAHLMYRWEHWKGNPALPWQANHAMQFRLKWECGLSTFATHYLLRSPQQILNVKPSEANAESKAYHRLDLNYIQNFRNLNKREHWSNAFSLQLWVNNVLGAGSAGRQFETALFWPAAQEPYWSDPQLRNLQLVIRQKF
jgi:hypothetical protein